MTLRLHLVVSLAILLLAFAGGLWTVRGAIGPATEPPAAFLLPEDFQLRPAQRIPVFRWAGGEQIERIGVVALRDDGRLGMEVYEGRRAAGANERTVLLEASMRTLWNLRTEPMREGLHARVSKLLSEGGHVVLSVFESPAFESDYAPAFRQFLRETMDAAWSAPQTRRAAQDAFGQYSETVLAEMLPVALPILFDNTRKALGESFSTNPTRFLGQILVGEIKRDILARAVDRTLNDPRVAENLDESLRAALSAPETEALAWAFARAFLHELDERREPLLALVDRLRADDRFASAFAALEQHTVDELRNVAGLIVGLGVTEGVHPVSATVIRAFLGLGDQNFVLVVPAGMAGRLLAGEVPAGTALRPVEASR